MKWPPCKSRVRTACPGLTGVGVTRERENVTRPVVMSRRNLLPPLSEMTTVQAPRPYGVCGTDGRTCSVGGGKCRAEQENGGCRRPEIVLFLICPDPDYPGFFRRSFALESAVSGARERRLFPMRRQSVRGEMSTKRRERGNMSKKRRLSWMF